MKPKGSTVFTSASHWTLKRVPKLHTLIIIHFQSSLFNSGCPTKNYVAHHYATVFNLLLLLPSWSQIFSTSSICVRPSQRQTKFDAHTQQVELQLCMFQSLRSQE